METNLPEMVQAYFVELIETKRFNKLRLAKAAGMSRSQLDRALGDSPNEKGGINLWHLDALARSMDMSIPDLLTSLERFALQYSGKKDEEPTLRGRVDREKIASGALRARTDSATRRLRSVPPSPSRRPSKGRGRSSSD